MKTSILILSLSAAIVSFNFGTGYAQDANADSNSTSETKESNSEASKKNKPEKKQVQTLFKNGGLRGAYFSGTIKPVDLNKQAGLLLGGEFAFVFGHKMNIGFSGYGLATDIRSNAVNGSNAPLYYELGYGGFFVEPVIGSHKLVHLTMPITLGAGGVSLNEKRWDYDYNSSDYGDRFDFFLIAETGVNLELNVFKVLRVDFGMGYRFVNDVNLLSTTNSDLKGFNGNITMKLGFF